MGSSCLSVSNTSNFNGLTPWASVSSSVKVKWKLLSHVWLFATPWTVHGLLQARILEWVAFPFSRKSSQPRDRTQVSHIAGGFFTSWATREAQEYWLGSLSLHQGIFPTQELNRGLLHSGGFFTNWAIREAHSSVKGDHLCFNFSFIE